MPDPPRPPVEPEAAARELERLRGYRVWAGRDQTITAAVAATQKSAARTQRQLGALIELWEAFVPSDLAARTALTSLRGGVLHVRADSTAVSYELDRMLREGLLVTLRERYRGTLTRVRITVT